MSPCDLSSVVSKGTLELHPSSCPQTLKPKVSTHSNEEPWVHFNCWFSLTENSGIAVNLWYCAPYTEEILEQESKGFLQPDPRIGVCTWHRWDTRFTPDKGLAICLLCRDELRWWDNLRLRIKNYYFFFFFFLLCIEFLRHWRDLAIHL